MTVAVLNIRSDKQMEYNYPLRYDWSTEEIIDVVAFYETIEKVYESGVVKERIMDAYRSFKVIVPSKSEEKTLFKEFKDVSGYDSYRVVKDAREATTEEVVKGAQR